MNNNDIQGLLQGFINKNGLKSSENDAKNRKQAEKLLNSLNSSQAEKLKSVLSDPKKSEQILNSAAAKSLFKRLNNG